ncbi:MAG: outer membrane beta-barrel protein [Bryobacterales bacterium]|nr:outer membrane beta-barrel protein [Bryobacterales bacterium]
MNKFAFAGFCGLLCMGTLSAQEVSHFSFDIGGGFTQPVGNSGRYLNDGWNVQAGVGYNFSNYVGAMLQTDFNSMGLNGNTLGNIGYGGANVNIFSATIDPIVHLTPKSHFDLYAIGGGGLYHLYDNFSGAPGSGFVSSFNGGSFPLVIPGVGSTYSVNKPGWNGGMGVAVGTKWHGKIFAEARYTHVFLSNGMHADYVPVTFGFRW